MIIGLATFMPGGGSHNALAQQIEFAAAIHLAFDRFETIDVAFSRTLAERRANRRTDCGFVSDQALRKPLKVRQITVGGMRQPSIESIKVMVHEQGPKALCEFTRFCQCRN